MIVHFDRLFDRVSRSHASFKTRLWIIGRKSISCIGTVNEAPPAMRWGTGIAVHVKLVHSG